MNFLDIKFEEYKVGDEVQYEIPLEYKSSKYGKAQFVLHSYGPGYGLEITTYITPEPDEWGIDQPEVSFCNFEATYKDLKDALTNKNNKLMNILEHLRKSLSYMCTGKENNIVFIKH